MLNSYLTEALNRGHVEDMLRDAERERLLTEVSHKAMTHRPLVGRVGFALIRAGAYLTRHAYRAA